VINFAKEKIFPLSEAPKRNELPKRRFKKRPHSATFYRWAKTGHRGVFLETIRVGGTLCTSVEALQRFFEALTGTDQPYVQSRKRFQSRPIEQIEQKLDDAGI
jgi:hypothetical protein